MSHIIENGDSAPTNSLSQDRRASERIPIGLEGFARFLHASTKDQWQANVLDYSSGGLLLLCSGNFQAGDIIELKLHGRQKSHIFTLKVIHTFDRGDGTWFVGGQFLDQGDDLKTLQ